MVFPLWLREGVKEYDGLTLSGEHCESPVFESDKVREHIRGLETEGRGVGRQDLRVGFEREPIDHSCCREEFMRKGGEEGV